MTVKTSLGSITATPDTLNALSLYLSAASELASDASLEIYVALKKAGFYDHLKDRLNA